MGWICGGAHDHEGWVANVLADGRVGAGSTSGGVIVHELTADDGTAGRKVFGSVDLDVVVPWDQVTTWRVVCECGWIGMEMPARGDPDPDPGGPLIAIVPRTSRSVISSPPGRHTSHRSPRSPTSRSCSSSSTPWRR